MFTTRRIQNALKAVLSLPLRIPAAIYHYAADTVKIIRDDSETVLCYSAIFTASLSAASRFPTIWNLDNIWNAKEALLKSSISQFDKYCREIDCKAYTLPGTDACLDYLAQNISVEAFFQQKKIEEYTLTPCLFDNYLLAGALIGATVGFCVGIGFAKKRKAEEKKIPKFKKRHNEDISMHANVTTYAIIPTYTILFINALAKDYDIRCIFILRHLLQSVTDDLGCVVNYRSEYRDVPYLSCQDKTLETNMYWDARKLARQDTLGVTVSPLTSSLLIIAAGGALIYSFHKRINAKERKHEKSRDEFLELYRTKLG